MSLALMEVLTTYPHLNFDLWLLGWLQFEWRGNKKKKKNQYLSKIRSYKTNLNTSQRSVTLYGSTD